jgi:formylmethanofuran dehydrogenase subunit D
MVNTLTMNAEDLAEIGIAPGSTVRAKSETGAAEFLCQAGKTPRGLIFVPYGPPTCRLMGYTTDGTGMPLSKGWEVEIELVSPPAAPAGGPQTEEEAE